MNIHDEDGAITTIGQHLTQWRAEAGSVGVSVAVVETGEVAWCGGSGYRQVPAEGPVGPDTVFQAASLSKPLFAYAVMRLVEAGRLDLDTPLSAYLPQPDLAADRRLPLITARRVMCHTAGLPNWRPEGKPLALIHSPGERFSYSGEGYVYLQQVVETLTGQPLDVHMAEAVLGPLGMVDSSYTWREGYEEQAAWGHDKAGTVVTTRLRQPNAAYTLYATAADFGRFLARLLQPAGTEPLPLREESLALMVEPQVTVAENLGWGLGWGVQQNPVTRSFWQWGDNGAFKAFAMASRHSGQGIVCFSNSEQGHRIWRPLLAAAFGKEQPVFSWLGRYFDE